MVREHLMPVIWEAGEVEPYLLRAIVEAVFHEAARLDRVSPTSDEVEDLLEVARQAGLRR